MPGIARVNQDRAGGLITGNLAPTVFVNGQPIAVKGASVQGHGLGSHAGPVIDGSSKTVFANGIGVARIGDLATCGDAISTGSGNVNAGGVVPIGASVLGISQLGQEALS